MIRLCLFIIINCFCAVSFTQEMVFPGDANNNGIVDQYDLLSIGYAFGETGPARIQIETTDFQGIPAFWDENFPNGIDYIYADCDGNGLVDYLDFLTLFNNFDTVLENAIPLVIEPGVGDFDPSAIWNNGVLEVAVTEGTSLSIPIVIPLNDLQAVNGIAFNLRYSSAHFQSAGFTNEAHWLAQDDEAMSIVMTDTPDLMQVATTRFGIDPVIGGGGNAGTLNLVIIIDMIDLLEAPDDTLITKIYLEDILMIDENFNAIPVASDTFEIKLYRDITAITSTQTPNELNANIFPNPSNGQLNLSSYQYFNAIEVVDMVGKIVPIYNGIARKRWESSNVNLAPGLYTIKVSGEKGISVLKYLVLK